MFGALFSNNSAQFLLKYPACPGIKVMIVAKKI